MALSSPGLGSNLDVNSIVSQLMSLERRPITLLNQKEASFQAKLSAYGSLKGQLTSFQSAMRGLNDVSRFQSFRTSVGDATIATATAANSAAPGSYALEVTKLAQAQKLVAAGQTSTTAAIGTGTLTFEFGTITGGTFDSNAGTYTGASFTAGSSGAKTVTIGTGDNTLEGIRDAINSAGIGVKASIVNDGGASPHRLALTVSDPGAARSLRIGVTGDAALSNLLAHDAAGTQNLSQTVTAQNAEFKIDGVSISKTSNTVTDAIEGVTLNLLKTNVGSATTVTVSRDTASARSSVDAFVKAYNDLNKTVRDLSSFNAATKQSTQLQGDVTVIQLQARVRSVLSTALTGVSGAYNTLGQIGVSFQKDGTLSVDSTKFQAALDAAPNDIASLFATVGRTTDSAVKFAGSGTASQPGTYALSVSALATRGSQTGSAAAGLTITAGVNDQLSVEVDGNSASITLAAGTYATAADLAREVQSKVNGATPISSTGATLTVTESGGVLTLTSARYGTASVAQITSGTGRDNLLGVAPVAATGTDVAGTINGTAATGSGQRLTDASGTGSAGLQVDVLGGATGDRGFVRFSRGYSSRLDTLIESLVATTGSLAARTNGLNASIEDIGERRTQIERRLQDTETRIRAQFTALDTLISKLQTTSSFLSQQLAKLDASTN